MTYIHHNNQVTDANTPRNNTKQYYTALRAIPHHAYGFLFCVHMCMCIHAWMCDCMCMYVRVHECVCMWGEMYMCISVCIYVGMHACVCIYLCVHVCMQVYMYVPVNPCMWRLQDKCWVSFLEHNPPFSFIFIAAGSFTGLELTLQPRPAG